MFLVFFCYLIVTVFALAQSRHRVTRLTCGHGVTALPITKVRQTFVKPKSSINICGQERLFLQIFSFK